MAGFGGSIKLTGESDYRKALQQITQGLREVSSSMNVVNSSYNKNDKSLSTLEQKQKDLNKVLEAQKGILAQATSSYNTFRQKVEEQGKKHEELKKRYADAKAELEEIGKTMGTTSKEYQTQQEKVTKLAKEVDTSTKNYDENQIALSKLKTVMNNAQSTVNNTEKAIDDLGNEAEETGKQAEKSTEGFTVFKGVLANLTTQAINGAINGLKKLGSAFFNLGKNAITNFAEYEQLVGGVETMFGDSADKLMQYSSQAYKTAGISSNQYMQQVTSFSASLLQSLGGDTEKAVEYSNRALIDMSDNANKMGTDMGSIQNAYQGFAKQNYTLLDNLKLGYGGTKTEMERLIKDASNLTDVQKELGITVDANDMSFGNIVNAISVMQTQMGIAGTTTKEAEETISGSINQMSASWSNLITGMADDNADFDGLINGFVKSFSAVLKNIIPRIKTTVKGIGQVINGLLKEMDKLLDDEMIDIIAEALTDIIKTISTGLPKMLKAGGDIIKTLAQGIIQMIPEMTKSLTEVIGGIVSGITELLPNIVQAGADILVNLANGIANQIPELAPKLVEVISSIVSTITENLPTIISAGVTLLTSLATGIVDAIPDLVTKIPEVITGIVTALTSEDAISSIITGAVSLFASIVEAIPQAVVNIGEAMPQIITAIVGGLIAGVGTIISTAVEIFTGIKDGAKESEQALRDEIGAISDFGDALNNTKPMLNDYNQLISDQGNTIGDLDKKTQEVEDAITEILKTAIADQKGLRDEDLQNIRDYMDKLNELQEEKLSIYRDQQLSELRKLQLESGIITQETAQQHLANTQEALNKVNQATEDAYTNRLTYIENKYKAMGEVGSEAYNKELADAKTWYDQSLQENQKYYDDAVKVVQEKSKEWVKADKDKWEEMDRYTDAFNKDNKSWLDKTIANFEDFVGANKQHLKYLTDGWQQMDLDGAQAFLELVGMMHKSGAEMDDETKDMVKAILGNFEDLPDSMQDVGGDTLQGLIGGMEDYIPELGDMSDMTADEIVDTIKKVLGIASPSKVMKELGKNTTQGLIEGMKAEQSNLITAGKNLAEGVQKGFLGQESTLKSKVLGMMSRVTRAVKKEMQINSPSKVYAQIGDYMAQGIGVGFTDEMTDVTKDINKSIPTSLDGVSGSNSNGINMVGAFKQALSEMKVVLDDAEVGTFIDKTVTQLVYAQ